MPQYPPTGFQPGPWTPYNGRPTFSTDAIMLDNYATWLASVRRPNVPAVAYGTGLTKFTGGTHDFVVVVPQYTRHVAVGLLVDGHGSVTITSDDGGTVQQKIDGITQGDGTVHTSAAAQWYWFDAKIGAPLADDHGAIRVTNASSPAVVQFSMSVVDASASESIRLYTVKFVPLVTGADDGAMPT